MPSKRDVLAQLSREELIVVVERFELEVADRRKKDDLLEAVASSKKATLADFLPDLGRERLRQLCAGLGLDYGGREKVVLIERLMPSGRFTRYSDEQDFLARPFKRMSKRRNLLAR
jgi:type I restriction enzyme M protein